MSIRDWLAHAGASWLVAALLLGLAELAVPGVFLIFLAVAAAITGVATLVLSDLPAWAQIGSFTVWSVATVLIGRRWYTEYPVNTADPLLNDRAARMIGTEVIVAEPIVGGLGRVRVGDGSWPARGPDMAIGSLARVIRMEQGIAVVEPMAAGKTGGANRYRGSDG